MSVVVEAWRFASAAGGATTGSFVATYGCVTAGGFVTTAGGSFGVTLATLK